MRHEDAGIQAKTIVRLVSKVQKVKKHQLRSNIVNHYSISCTLAKKKCTRINGEIENHFPLNLTKQDYGLLKLR